MMRVPGVMRPEDLVFVLVDEGARAIPPVLGDVVAAAQAEEAPAEETEEAPADEGEAVDQDASEKESTDDAG